MKMVFNKKNVLQSSAGGRGSAVASSGGGLRGAFSRGLSRVGNFISGRR